MPPLHGGDQESASPRLYSKENHAVAASVVYAFTQPDRVAVNEVLVEPRDEPV